MASPVPSARDSLRRSHHRMEPPFRKVVIEPGIRTEIQSQVRAIMQEVKRKVPERSSSSSHNLGSSSIFSRFENENGDEAKAIEGEDKLKEEINKTVVADESAKVAGQPEDFDDAKSGVQKRSDASDMGEATSAGESDEATKELTDANEFDDVTLHVERRSIQTDEENNQLEAKLDASINAAHYGWVTEGPEHELLHDMVLTEAKEKKDEAAAAALPPFTQDPTLYHQGLPGVEHNKRLTAVNRPIHGTNGVTLNRRRRNRQNLGSPPHKPTKGDLNIRSMEAIKRPTVDKMAGVAKRSFPESKLIKRKLATRGFKTWVYDISHPKKEPVIEGETNADRHQRKIKDKQHKKEQNQAAKQQKSIEKAKAHEKGVPLPIGGGAKTKRGHHKRLAAPSDNVSEAQQASAEKKLKIMRMRVAAGLPPTRRGIAASKHDDTEVNKVHAFVNKYGKGKDHRDTPEDVVEHLQTMTAEEYRDMQNLDQAAMDKIINEYIDAHPEDVPWIEQIKAAAMAELNRNSDAVVTLPPKNAPAAEHAATEGNTVDGVIAPADGPAILRTPTAGLNDRLPTTAPDAPAEVVAAAPPPVPTVPAPPVPVEKVEVVDVAPVDVDTDAVEVSLSPENEAAPTPPLAGSSEERPPTPPPEPTAEDIPEPLESSPEETTMPETAAIDNPMVVVNPLTGSGIDLTENIEARGIPRGHKRRTFHQYLNQEGKGRYHDHSPPPPTVSQMVSTATPVKPSPAPIKEGLPAINSHGFGRPVDKDEAERQAAAVEALHHTKQEDFKPRIKEGIFGLEPRALDQCFDANCPFNDEYHDQVAVGKRGKTLSDDSDVKKIHDLIDKHGKGKDHDHIPPNKVEEGLHGVPKHGTRAPIGLDDAERQAEPAEALHHTRSKEFYGLARDEFHHEGMAVVEEYAPEQCSGHDCPLPNYYVGDNYNPLFKKRAPINAKSWLTGGHRIIHKGDLHTHLPAGKEGLPHLNKGGTSEPIPLDEAAQQAAADRALTTTSKNAFKPDPEKVEWMKGVDEDGHGGKLPSDAAQKRDCTSWAPLGGGAGFGASGISGKLACITVEKRGQYRRGDVFFIKKDNHETSPYGNPVEERMIGLDNNGQAEALPQIEAEQQAAANWALASSNIKQLKKDTKNHKHVEGNEWAKGVETPSEIVKRGHHGEYRGEDVFYAKDNNHKAKPYGTPVEEGMIGIDKDGQAEPIPQTEAEKQAAADSALVSSNLKQLKKEARNHSHFEAKEWSKSVETPSENAKRGYRGEDVFFVKDNNHLTHQDRSLIEEGLVGTDKNGQAEPIPLTEAEQQIGADEALGKSNLKQLKKESKLHQHVRNERAKGVETPSDVAGTEQLIDGRKAFSEPVSLDEAAKQAADINLVEPDLKQLQKKSKQNEHVEVNEWTKGVGTPSQPSITKRNAQYAYLPILNNRPIFPPENNGLRGTSYDPSSKTVLPQNGVPTGAHVNNDEVDAYATDAATTLNMDHIKDLRNHFGSTGNPQNEVGKDATKNSKRGVFTKEFKRYMKTKGKGKQHNDPVEKPALEVVPEQAPLATAWKDSFKSHLAEKEWIKRFKKDTYGGKLLDIPDKYQRRVALNLEDYRADGEDGLDIQFHPLNRLTHEPVQHGIAKRGAYTANADTYKPVNGMQATLDKVERRVGVKEEDDAKARGYADSRHLAGATARKERQKAAESVKEIAKNLEQERAAEQAAVEEKAEKMMNNVAGKTGTSKSEVAQVVHSMGPGGKISKPAVGEVKTEYHDHDTFDPLKAHAAEDKKAAAKKLAKEKMAEVEKQMAEVEKKMAWEKEKETAKADKQYHVHGADMVDHPQLTHHNLEGGKHSHHDGDHKHHPTPLPTSTDTSWPLYKPGENVVTPAQIQDALRGTNATVNGNGEEIGNTGMFLIIGAWIAVLFLIMKIAKRSREEGTQGGWWPTSMRKKRISGDLERLETAEKGGYIG